MFWQTGAEEFLRRSHHTTINRLATIEQKLDVVINEVRAFRRDEQRSDLVMADVADDILTQLEAANTRQDEFLVILQALKDNQNDPAKLQAIARSISEQQDDWEAAFAANIPPEEPPVEPPVE